MSLRTNCCKTFLFVFALLAVAILAVPAFAGNTCLQDEYNNVAKQKLNCTANDVRVAEAVNTRALDGSSLTTCIEGSTFNFIADFEIVTSSTSSRSNIGLYMATQGTTSALASGGSCIDNIIQPGNPLCAGSSITCGSDVHNEFDPQPDNCGDTSSQDNGAFGAGSQKVTVEIQNFSCSTANSVPCPNDATKRCLTLPNCTSWQIPGGTIQCNSPSPSFPWVQAAIPGTPSKCNCGVISLPITPVTITPVIQKACTTGTSSPNPPTFDPGFEHNPATSPTQSPTSCDAGAEGSTVTYTVAVSNPSNTANNNGVVDQLCDDKYGTIYRSGSFTGPACPAGSLANAPSSTSCPPSPVAPLGTQTCTFAVQQGEDASITDTVTAWGHSSLNTTSTFGGLTGLPSNTVTVTSSDAPSTATVTKGLDSITAGCVTARYSVDVHNSSGADEVLSLSAFNDSAFGSITTVHTALPNAVLGTTCGVGTASQGLGTLSGSSGAGTLPASLAVGTGTNSHYVCKFDGEFCGAIATITKPDTTTCLGLQHVNKVTGTINGDEGVNDVVTQTGDTLTVDECFTSFTSTTIP